MQDIECITSTIQNFVDDYPNHFDLQTSWREPIVGVADANDPLFAELKTIIGPNHNLPSDIVENAQSVICYFIPFSKKTIKSNIDGEDASDTWDIAYVETNKLITDLTQHLYEVITEKGYEASNLPPTYNFDTETLTCAWSHRSAAFIAGLGTFGINHMLITEAGCCGRLGSVITSWKLPATPRPEKELCLFLRNGTCGACVAKCPAGALTIEGPMGKPGTTSSYDKFVCNNHVYRRPSRIFEWGVADTCGKCMAGVSCSWADPTRFL